VQEAFLIIKEEKVATKKEKGALVQKLKEKLQQAKVFIFTDFRGLNVQEITELRRQFRHQAMDYQVVKNTLLLRALDGFPAEDFKKYLRGPTAIALGYSDPIIPAKVLVNFSRDHPQLQIKGGCLEGRILEPETVISLAQLPSREVLRAHILMMLHVPLQNLVMVLRTPLYKLVGNLEAIKNRLG